MNFALFMNMLIAHFLADFPLQRDVWVNSKAQKHLLGSGMWLHSLVVFACTIVALGGFGFWRAAVCIVCSHILIDYSKVRFTRRGPRAFALDQFLHIGTLALVASYGCELFDCEWHQWSFVPEGGELLYPMVACVYLFCLSPANYGIVEVLRYCHVKEDEGSAKSGDAQPNDTGRIKRCGMLIGSAERFLVLTFILVGNFEAAGLTVAAKSLLRFNDNDAPRTEYVLVGTLLSIIVAVLSALIIFKFGLNRSIIKFS